jgi:hypothetical protein
MSSCVDPEACVMVSIHLCMDWLVEYLLVRSGPVRMGMRGMDDGCRQYSIAKWG